MPSFLSKIKSLPSHLPHGTSSRHGVKGFLVDKGTRYVASGAFGYAKGNLGDKFLVKGHGLDLWLGAAFTALAALFHSNKFAPTMERIGDAGMQSAINSLSASYGLDHAGHTATITPAKKTVAGGGRRSVIGMIDPAKPGPYLSDQRIRDFANRR